MGTGNITLYWYGLCCFFTIFVLLCTGGIIAYSRLDRWRKGKAKAAELEAKAEVDSED